MRKIVDFYNNQPVFPLDAPLAIKNTSEQPMFHIGSVMPFADNDAAALQKAVSLVAKEGMVTVEIGSWTGKSTVSLAKIVGAKRGTVFAIDHWQGSANVWQYEIAKQYDILSVFRHNTESAGVAESVRPIVSDSLTAAKIFADESLDFAFIDADHRYTPVKNDILTWLPKVKQGGILAGHDCSGFYSKYPEETKKLIDSNLEKDDVPGIGHPGVIKALFDCFQDKHSIMPNSVVWYYQK